MAFPTALAPVTGEIFHLDGLLLDEGVAASRQSARRRIILPIHRTSAAPVQRMLNFLQPGTYIQPHRHPSAGASETISVLQGGIDFFQFDEAGHRRGKWTLNAGDLIDFEPGLWHTFVCRERDTVLLEIKLGPYKPAEDKEFAGWAPAEGDKMAGVWLTALMKPEQVGS